MSMYLGAVGIGVSDLEISLEFYTSLLGMTEMQTLKLPHMNEIILGYEGSRSASVVLMNYVDGSERNYKNNPIKLVFYMPDTAIALQTIANAGYPIVSEAKPYPSLGGAIIGFAKDPDGYLIEIIQKPAKK